MAQRASASLGSLYAGFIALVFLQAILLAAALLSFREMETADHWSVHTYQVLVETGGVGESLVNMDTGARGFALTGEERFLQPLRQGRATFLQHYGRAQQLTVDNPLQQQRLRRLREEYFRWDSVYLEELLAARRAATGHVIPSELARIAKRGKPYTDAMRSILADVNATESHLLEQRSRRVAWLRLWTRGVSLGGGAFALLLTGLLCGLLVRSTQRLRMANGQLESEISERKRSEEELRQTQEEAERARAEAERANLAKSEFLSRMSHELRTPLNAILGFGQLLEVHDLTPRQHQAVEHILKGGRHLLDLINEVLEIARIESGQMQLSPEPVAAADLIRETLSLVRPLATPRGIRLEERNGPPDSGRLFVRADRQRLRQVLLNLLSNAIKYNRDEGRVLVEFQPAADHNLRISVSDTGPGIAPDRVDRLFVAFDRLGAEQTQIEGTGLGLALSRHLVEAMGGRMGVESTVAQGTTFWVELPLTEAPGIPAETRFEDAPAMEVENQPRTLLYIEDNLSNLNLITMVLERRPWIQLLSAPDGEAGLALALERLPDLILLDLHLPGLPGHEVLLRLRAEPAAHEIPVLVLSADATPGQIAHLLGAGANGYLTKPLDLGKFLAAVDGNLGITDGKR